MRIVLIIGLVLGLSSCWPKSISFKDGSMPDEWKTFYVQTLTNNSSNTPLNYPVDLSESIKSGIQNNTRLQLNNDENAAEVFIEGVISNYSVTPVALQEGDNAAKNRLTVSVTFNFFISKPEEKEMQTVSTRYVDYDANTDLGTVENELLAEINEQIVQDVINKLLANW